MPPASSAASTGTPWRMSSETSRPLVENERPKSKCRNARSTYSPYSPGPDDSGGNRSRRSAYSSHHATLTAPMITPAASSSPTAHPRRRRAAGAAVLASGMVCTVGIAVQVVCG
jgi:hypothetical protein